MTNQSKIKREKMFAYLEKLLEIANINFESHISRLKRPARLQN